MIDNGLIYELYFLFFDYFFLLILTLITSYLFYKNKFKFSLLFGVFSISVFINFFYGFQDHHSVDKKITAITFSLRSNSENKIQDIGKVIRDYSPDILFLQEINKGDEFKDSIVINFPNYTFVSNDNKSTALMTLYPVNRVEFIGNIQKVSLEIKGEDVISYNFHAPKFFLNYMNFNRFYNSLLDDINSKENEKVIVAGDFNLIRNNTPRKKIESELNFKGALSHFGSGSISTFPGPGHKLGFFGSFFSIDEIYVKGIKISFGSTIDFNSSSDHKPVVAYLEL